MKTTQEVTKRIEMLEQRLAKLKEEKKQSMTKVSNDIRECADDPMYVAKHIKSWTSGIDYLTERIERMEDEIEIVKWVL